MEITRSDYDNTIIFTLAGNVTIRTAPEVHETVHHALEEGPARMIVSLAGVENMDSSGVGIMVTALKLAKSKAIPFAIADIPERVMAIFEMTRLTTIFTIYSDCQTALRELT